MIDKFPDTIFIILLGTKNGEIFLGPPFKYASLLFSIPGNPPIPLPIATPMRSAFSSVASIPESLIAWTPAPIP